MSEFTIHTNYSYFWILVCVFVALLYAFTLYYKEKNIEISKWQKYTLYISRTLAVLLLCVLLLSPYLKSYFRIIEKPSLVLGIDNSESMLLSKDSSFVKKELLNFIVDLENKLSEKYEIKKYNFGNNTSDTGSLVFKDKISNVGQLFDEIENNCADKNIAQVLLITDGIFNQGNNPMYHAITDKYAITTLAIGDTTEKKDAFIDEVVYNKQSYLGNTFPLQFSINAKQLLGKTALAKVLLNGNQVYTENIVYNNNVFTKNILLQLESKQKGINKVELSIEYLNSELNMQNNYKEIFVEINDNKQKVLLLASDPHPDIAAIKNAIEQNQNYEFTYSSVENFNKNIADYNLVIFHQIPSKTSNNRILSELQKSNTSLWFIVGNNTNLQQLSTLNIGIRYVQSNFEKQNDVLPLYNNVFSLFTVNESWINSLKSYPPLVTPYSKLELTPSFEVFLKQKIGVVETQEPLLAIDHQNNRKIAVLNGEGLWKWRMNEYKEHNTHQNFDELVLKIVQYLSNKEVKEPFKIIAPQIIDENEELTINAELYNNNNELINNATVNFELYNSKNKKFENLFSPYLNYYKLNLSKLQPDIYNYTANTTVNGKPYIKKGKVIVTKTFIEQNNTVANNSLLRELSKKTKGTFFDKNNYKNISEFLLNSNLKPKIKSEKKQNELIHFKWIFVIILSLLSIEWFIRKYNGGY
jgi:hypothetical protein